MQKPLFVLLFTLLFGNISNAQHFHWAKKIGGTHAERVIDMATDPSGNIISTGYFSGSVDFDPGPGISTFANPGGGRDGFIQKLDAKGNLLWAKQITNVLYDYKESGDAIQTDAAGNIYVAGRFEGTVDFDPGPGVFQLTSKNTLVSDIYVLKLDAAGNFIWAVQRQTLSNFEKDADNVALALDASNNIYLTYSFSGTAGFWYMFIEKANSTGTKIWDYKTDGMGWPGGYIIDPAITVDASGNIIVAGTFGGTYKFDPASSNGTNSLAGDNAFILKLDNSGNYTWLRTLLGASTAHDVAINAAGDIYIAGNFSGVTDFDPGPALQLDTATGNWQSMYVLKLTQAGNYSWVQQFAGTGNSVINALAVDAADNVYAAGDFSYQLTFKNAAPAIIKNSVGNSDAFAMKLTGTGNLARAKQIGGPSLDQAVAIAIDNIGNVYTGGIFSTVANFDLDGTGFNMTSTGTSVMFDAFVCKFGTCAVVNTSVTKNGTSTLSAAATGVSYQWINCNSNTPVAGATANTFAPTTSGSYAVVLTQNGCSDTSSCYSVIGTGISETKLANIATIFPNPCNGAFTITGIASDKNAIVHITNVYGQQVSALQTKVGNNIHVDLNAAGIYFVTVSTASGKQTEKIVVQ